MRAATAQQVGVLAYSSEIEHYNADNLELVGELGDAIDSDQLVLHYQPQIEAATGRAVAIEALWRWQHPTRGLIVPDQFLPLAEETEVIETVTDWVLATALRDVKRMAEMGFDMSVAVNVSPRTIARDDFTPRVLKALVEAGVAPSRLTVEVTETALLADHSRGGAVLSGLASSGVGVSLDDFGRGQTSLGYLSSLPVDELKIDRSFVTDMNDHAGHEGIVRSVIGLAHNLGMTVVAEGVETADVLSSLRIAHCDRVQGFHTARPMPLEELMGWLATRPVPVVAAVAAPKAVVPVRKRRTSVRAARFVRDWASRDIRVNSGR
jgi:diguanylate cyclase